MEFLIVEARAANDEEQEHDEHGEIGHQERRVFFYVAFGRIIV